jgi:apolipoprotein N-acyltransferase
VLTGTFTRRTAPTFYTRYGDLFAWATMGVSVAALLPLPLRRRRPVEVTIA